MQSRSRRALSQPIAILIALVAVAILFSHTRHTSASAAPTCTLTPASQSITSGNTATLNYTISGSATSATINGVSVTIATSSTYVVSPTGTTDYVLSVSNQNGTNTCGPATVIVNGLGPTTAAITGYAWSDTIGWIDLNCSNSGVCGSNNFGLTIDPSGSITGYAWSDNVGWVSANSPDLIGCPSAPCTAKITGGTGALSGWLKAIGADNNGWDGWISLSGTGYGPVASAGNFSGYAWGSTNVGWVDFSQAHTTWSVCTPNYYCSGNNQYYQNAQCVSSLQQTCSYQCTNGACVPPPAPVGSITANPALAHQNSRVTVSWSVSNSTSCRVTGTNGDAWNGISGSASSSVITRNVVYTLSCANALGATSTVGTASVSIVPIWQEL